MKQLFSFFICLLMTTPSMADTFLNVHQKDGSIVKYAFADKPVLTYTRTTVVISTVNVQIDYPVKELIKITIEDINTSIEDVEKTATIAGKNTVYDINGRFIATFDSSEYFDINSLPSGVFVVKNDLSTYKIINK